MYMPVVESDTKQRRMIKPAARNKLRTPPGRDLCHVNSVSWIVNKCSSGAENKAVDYINFILGSRYIAHFSKCFLMTGSNNARL